MEDRIKYFYEFAFWSVINKYNQEKLKNNDDKNLITTTEARYLRKKLQNELDKNASKFNNYNVKGLAAVPVSYFKSSMKEVFKDKIDNLYDDNLFSDQETNFRNITKVKNGELTGVMPVSPFDLRYMDLENSLEFGPNLMAITSLESITKDTDLYVNYNPYSKDNNQLESLEKSGNLKKFITNNDLTGLSKLKRFMTTDEYGVAERWITDVSDKVDDKYLNNSIAILEELNSLGMEYDIKPGLNKGQLEAFIKGTDVSVRILDVPENSKYIGSIYNGFGRVYFTTTRYVKDEKGGSFATFDPTPQDIRNLLNYALGNDVKAPEGDYSLGEPKRGQRMIRGKKVPFNANFSTKNNLTIDYKAYDSYNNRVRITLNKPRITEDDINFKNEEDAEKFIRESIAEAKENVYEALKVEDLILHFNENGNFDSFVFASDPEIKDVQEKYVSLLLGYTNVLQKPSFELDEFERKIDSGEFSTEGVNKAIYNSMYESFSYPNMSPEEMIKIHAKDFTEHFVGSYDLDFDHNMRFNAKVLGDFSTLDFSRSKFNKELINALKLLKVDMDTIYGDENYKNYITENLITFDSSTAIRITDLNSDFYNKVNETIINTLRTSGVQVDENSISIDVNGIVKYEGLLPESDIIDGNPKFNKIEGYIGQIFDPDEMGVVRTKFNGDNNYAFVPGYTATIVSQKENETKSMFERTKLVGYEEALIQALKYKVRSDVISNNKDFVKDSSIGLNFVYKNLYEDRYSLDFIEEFKEQGMPEDIMESIIKTQGQKVRYSSEIRDNSSVHADYLSKRFPRTLLNDNNRNAFTLTSGQNISILEENADGYFDPIATNSTSTNQGAIRYLVEGAKLDENGFIIPSDKDDRCTFMKSEIAENFKYNPYDRQNMTLSNVLTAFSISEPVGVAQMTINGWTYDDPMVISKRFAKEHRIKDATSKEEVAYRDLMIGDKLSDLHGNKGVISLIVDPDMLDEEAKSKGILKEVQLFRDNPKLDIVMAPFPAVSRYNGGTNRELMSGKKEDLILDGENHSNSIGFMRVVVTDKSVDDKTHIYDKDAFKQGKGRKVSSQLAWAFNSKDANNIMKECYGSNINAFEDLKEYAEVCGVYIDDFGDISLVHQDDGLNRERPTLSFIDDLKDRQRLTKSLENKMLEKFKDTISESGGYMELPFELKYPTGEFLKADKVKEDVFESDNENGINLSEKENYVYKLPVLSKFLRSEQSLDDGEFVNHDYSIAYMNIYKAAINYKLNEFKYDEALQQGDEKKTQQYSQNMKVEKEKAQFNFDEITGKINERVLSGKKNIFKEQIMGKRIPNSATAVWTSNPRLGIDEVALGRGVADNLKVSDGDYVLLWRDPILRDSGVRYLKVKVSDDIVGASINPSLDKPFDGDFDGDSVGIIKVNTKVAKKEAFDKFSVQNNLLDYGSKDENGQYDLAIGTSLDHKVAGYYNPYIKERFSDLKKYVNEFEQNYKIGKISESEVNELRAKAVDVINVVLKDSFEKATGKSLIKYDENHLQSVYDSCIKTGAKGSPSKFRDYMSWVGFKADIDEENGIVSNVQDMHDTLSTRSQHIGTMYATAIKSFGTGIAGAFSQRGMKALRNKAPKAVLELTYPVTQSILQAKHDPVDAKHKYELIMSTTKDLWDGGKLEKTQNGEFISVRENGKVVKDDYISWKKNFYDFYTSKQGLNVDINKDFVDEVASYLKNDDNIMEGITEQTFAPLDRLAYGNGIKTLREIAEGGNYNLYEGKYNEMFKPRAIQFNQDVRDGVLDKDYKDLDKTDIKETSNTKAYSPKYTEAVYTRLLALSGEVPQSVKTETKVLEPVPEIKVNTSTKDNENEMCP